MPTEWTKVLRKMNHRDLDRAGIQKFAKGGKLGGQARKVLYKKQFTLTGRARVR